MARSNMYTAFRHNDFSALSDAEIKAQAPAVFSMNTGYRTSEKYLHVPTFEIMNEFRAQGYMPVEVQQRVVRSPLRSVDTAPHLIRFSRAGARGKMEKRGDVIPQIVMRNSHDGGVRLEFYQGVFRMVCANGLIVSDQSVCSPIKASHRAMPALIAMSAIQDVVNQQKSTFDHIDAMRGTALTEKRQLSFARGALSLLPERAGMLSAESLLIPRRGEDAGSDVWSVYNRVQENVFKGDIEATTATGRKTKYHGISTIHRQMDMNAGLWAIAMDAIGRASASSKRAATALEASKATAEA